MSFSERIFSLTNSSGETMHGVVHETPESNGTVVIMFNIGLHYRVCHSRLFVKQARHLQNEGFTVVRFDPSRVGYSHGEIRVDRAIDCYDSVQTGLFRDDACQLIAYVRQQYRPRKLYLYGLCGGALTATIAAAHDQQVDGVLFVAGPVTVTSAEHELSNLHPLHADLLVSGYMRRLFSPRAWARFFGGKTSYRELFQSLKVKLSSMLPRKPQAVPADGQSPSDEDKGAILNGPFLEAFDKLMRAGKDILFLMPELDRATYDFDKIFARSILPHYTEFDQRFSVERVAKANHTFSTAVSSRQLFEIAHRWLSDRLNR